MLNTLPPTITPCSPGLPIPPRRRGGQPSNRNALKYGCFAEKNPTSLTDFLSLIRVSLSGMDKIPEVFDQAILATRKQIALLVKASQEAADLRSTLSCQRPILRLFRLLIQVKKAQARHQQPLLQLQLVAEHALDLIRYDFHAGGITRDAYSFREKNKLSDLNSPACRKYSVSLDSNPPALFLADHQWAVIESFIPPSDSTDRRGRPSANPRPLLDAIFWKFAHNARWQDLPNGSPPLLTCRRYYRRLFLSGRLFTLYSVMYKYLLSHSNVDLTALVKQDCFSIAGNTLILCPGLQETWQIRTALLFMQQGWQVSRQILRQKDREQRLRFRYSPWKNT
jgi:hypothetical protein